MANAIRALAMDAVQKANSGHPGMPMGMADVATVLFTRFLKFDAAHPDWPDRDRFVLSAGHGSMLLYALLYLTGYPDMTIEELKHFRQLGSPHAGHPEYGHAPGIETTTGPLGQGLGNAVGMALAERLLNARFGDDIVDHYTYCVAGDGCLMEGISHEAISLAGHLKLGQPDRAVRRQPDLDRRADQPCRVRRPARALRGLAAGTPPGSTATIRRRSPGHRECARRHRQAVADRLPHHHRLRRADQGRHRRHPRLAARRRGDRRRAREARLAASRPSRCRSRSSPPGARRAPGIAPPTRLGSSGREAPRCDRRAPRSPIRIDEQVGAGDRGGRRRGQVGVHRRRRQARHAAILAEGAGEARAGRPRPDRRLGRSHRLERHARPSCTTMVKPGDFAGNYIHYGVREHGMAAAMNGMALHGGIVPYGGTFLVFTDYCRPSIRLSALMRPARDLRDDPRFDRARRGRPDPSAGRASGGAARHPQSQRLPPGRLGRDAPSAGSLRCWPRPRPRSWR